MTDELIFHLVPRRKWNKQHREGFYEPKTLDEKGYIPCLKGNQINEEANRLYGGERKVLLLVIDLATVKPDVTFEEVETDGTTTERPRVQGPLNTDAIIEKIHLTPDKEAGYDIKFESN